MTPYYRDDLVTLYLGDAREIDEWAAADVLLADPPYGISYQSGQKSETIARSILNDHDTSVRDALLAMWGTEKQAIVFGSPRVERPAGWKQVLIWDKKGALGMGNLGYPWKPGHEEMYVMGSDKGWRGRRSNDVIQCAPVQSTSRNGRVHPHQKPIALLEELLRKLPAGIVGDPTVGSGSTLVAASRLGVRSIGVELNEADCEKAAQRLQGDLGQALIGDWDGHA